MELIEFILVRPVYLGNIGAMARLMKNFCFGRLTLVEPPKQYKDAEARKMAVGAFDVLKAARICSTLTEALADIQLSIGTTCAQQRAQEVITLSHVTPLVMQAIGAGNRVAIVLGDERNGLTTAELNLCHRLVRIPTDAEFPSMNLASAAAVIAYELVRDSGERADAPADTKVYPTGREEHEFFEQLGILLDSVEFSRSYNREPVLAELRAIYKRITPTQREVALLKGIMHKLNAGQDE